MARSRLTTGEDLAGPDLLDAETGYEFPLAPLEKWARKRGGGEGYEGWFVDRNIENVIYPEEYTPPLRALVAVMIVTGYVGLFRSEGRRRISGRDALHRRR